MLLLTADPMNVMEGDTATVCAVLDLPDGTTLGCDIEVPFVAINGSLASMCENRIFKPQFYFLYTFLYRSWI